MTELWIIATTKNNKNPEFGVYLEKETFLSALNEILRELYYQHYISKDTGKVFLKLAENVEFGEIKRLDWKYVSQWDKITDLYTSRPHGTIYVEHKLIEKISK